MTKINFFWIAIALLALVSCSDSGNSSITGDPGDSSNSGDSVNSSDSGNSSDSSDSGDSSNSSDSANSSGGSNSSNILQNTDMTFVNGQVPIKNQTATISNTEFVGTLVPGASIKLNFASSKELSEFYLQIEGEGGYYVRPMSAADLVSTASGSYNYSIILKFSSSLEIKGGFKFAFSGKAEIYELSSSSSGDSGSFTILQTIDIVFMSGQDLPANTVSIVDTEFTGTMAPGGSVALKIITEDEMSEFYLQIEGENGYYVRQISAADLVSSVKGRYEYSIPLKFSPELSNTSLRFVMSGKAKPAS